MTTTNPECSPTEYLIMEVLAARWRLHEMHWPIPKKNRQALDRLVERGWVWYADHIVAGEYRVHLTPLGQSIWDLNKPYDLNPPIPQAIEDELAETWPGGAVSMWNQDLSKAAAIPSHIQHMHKTPLVMTTATAFETEDGWTNERPKPQPKKRWWQRKDSK